MEEKIQFTPEYTLFNDKFQFLLFQQIKYGDSSSKNIEIKFKKIVQNECRKKRVIYSIWHETTNIKKLSS